MSALPLFYCPELQPNSLEACLTEAEARHVYGAKRLIVGSLLSITNGHGLQAIGEISQINKKKHTVHLILQTVESTPEPQTQVRLLVAVPKGDRQSMLLDMATQLGVTEIIPLVSKNSVLKLKANSLERWNRIAIEASKQSRRAWFPLISAPVELGAWLDTKLCDRLTTANSPADSQIHLNGDTSIMVLDQGGKAIADYQEGLQNTSNWLVLIGPEGGFTENELARIIKLGAKPITLGAHILRIETAAVAIISALNQLRI